MAVFGGSRVQIAGPTGAFVIILSSIVQKHGFEGLQIATFLAGLFLVFMGVFKLGSMIKYIPEPVIVGFTSGIAVTIFLGQWKDFFGLTVHFSAPDLCSKFVDLIHAFPTYDLTTTLLAIGSLQIICLTNKYLKPIPGFLMSLIIATAVQSFFQFESVATIGTAFGGIPQSLPSPQLPRISPQLIAALIGPAFTIALLGAIESLLSAAVADSMLGTRHNSNQELIGQGLANLIAPLFGGFAATSAIARTATNIKSGGNSPLAGIVHCVTIILFILFLAPIASSIPIATLSAVLFVVAYNMSDYRRFYRILTTAPHSDRFVLIVSFTLTLFVDLVVAVNIGVIFATLFFMRRMAKTVQIEHNTNAYLMDGMQSVEVPKDVSIYSIEGPFFFGAIETFQSILSNVHDSVHTIIIRLQHVPFIDVSAIDTLRSFTTNLEKKSIKVIFCEANSLVFTRMQKARLVDSTITNQFNCSLHEAIDKALS